MASNILFLNSISSSSVSFSFSVALISLINLSFNSHNILNILLISQFSKHS